VKIILSLEIIRPMKDAWKISAPRRIFEKSKLLFKI